jgi:dipeptidyl-peptidase-4
MSIPLLSFIRSNASAAVASSRPVTPLAPRAVRSAILALAAAIVLLPGAARAQLKDPGFTLEQVMSVSFAHTLVGARSADRIAWIEVERGMRNVFTAAAQDFAPVRLTSTIADDAVDLTSLAISDDGSVVVFVRGHSTNRSGQVGNQASDPGGGRREVWAASTTGARTPWRVVAANAVTLSPDGNWVLYVENGQIYRATVNPGNANPAQVDDEPPLFVTLGTNSAPVWSPDGRKIAFVSSRVDQRSLFPTQGAQVTHSFIGVYDLDARRVTYLAPSVDRDSNPVWSPDGQRIAFMRRPGLPFGHFATTPLQSITREQVPAGFLEHTFEGGHTLGIWIANVATGEAQEVWHPAAGAAVVPNAIRWEGDHFAFSAVDNTWTRWYSIPASASSAQPVLLTPGEGQVERVAFSPDGRFLYFTSNVGDQDRRHLWRVALGGGQPQQLTRGALVETTVTLPGSGQNVAVLQSGPKQGVSVAILPPTGGQGRVIGPRVPSEFPVAKHVDPQSVAVTAADGIVANIILFVPPDIRPGERRPALLYVHGNGGRLVLGYPDQSNGYYHVNYALIQYFVTKGYIVAASNYRGDGALYTPAYNDPPEYGANGVSEYRDVIAAGLYLKGRPDVDAERLGIWGLSYGGWLTGEALSRNSDVFKAGAIFAGVQLRSQSLDPRVLAYQSSPAFNIDKWTSPTLILHGDDDRNVEFSQTIGLVSLLRARRVPHKAVVYPDETHYFMRFATMVDSFRELDRWFDRMLINKEGVRTSEQGGRP